MAKLRRIGRGLQSMSDSLSPIMRMLYQKKLDDEQAKQAFEWRKTLDTQQQGSSQLITLAQNPEVARRLAQTGQKFGQVDPTPFAPSQEEIVGEVGTKIGETTRENLPGDLLIEAQLAGKGVGKDPRPIEQLMAIRQERERRLSDEELRQLRESERIDPTTGVKVKGPEGNTIALERTGEQEGARKQAELLGGELSKPVTTAKASQQGAVSYAGSAGSAGGQIDAQHNRLDKISAIEAAKEQGGSGGTGNLPAAIQERIAAADAALYGIERAEKLFNEGMKDLVGPVRGRWESFKNIAPGLDPNPKFAEFEAEVTGIKNTIIKYYTGAQMSEPEAQRLAAQVGAITNKPEVFPIKLRVLRENMQHMKERMIATAQGRQLGAFEWAVDPTEATDSRAPVRWTPGGPGGAPSSGPMRGRGPGR